MIVFQSNSELYLYVYCISLIGLSNQSSLHQACNNESWVRMKDQRDSMSAFSYNDRQWMSYETKELLAAKVRSSTKDAFICRWSLV